MRPFKGTPLWGGSPREVLLDYSRRHRTVAATEVLGYRIMGLSPRVQKAAEAKVGFPALCDSDSEAQEAERTTAGGGCRHLTKPVQERGHGCCKRADP